jgi:hypothetical protein
MLESIPGLSQLLFGAVAGVGHAFGQRLVRLILQLKHEAPFDSPAPGPQPGHSAEDASILADAIGTLKEPPQWEEVNASLVEAGVPLDRTAEEQLSTLRDEVLRQATSSKQAVGRLAGLTAEAFARAGVELPDLERWERLSQRLAGAVLDDNLEEPAPIAPNVAVAGGKQPKTWWIWNKGEVDKRLLRFLRRGIDHCWTACNQALAKVRDVGTLRELYALREQLGLAKELLSTMPTLTPSRKSLRVDGALVKELIQSVHQAVASTDDLTKHLNTLLNSEPASAERERASRSCGQAAALLVQTLRDRRAVR